MNFSNTEIANLDKAVSTLNEPRKRAALFAALKGCDPDHADMVESLINDLTPNEQRVGGITWVTEHGSYAHPDYALYMSGHYLATLVVDPWMTGTEPVWVLKMVPNAQICDSEQFARELIDQELQKMIRFGMLLAAVPSQSIEDLLKQVRG